MLRTVTIIIMLVSLLAVTLCFDADHAEAGTADSSLGKINICLSAGKEAVIVFGS